MYRRCSHESSGPASMEDMEMLLELCEMVKAYQPVWVRTMSTNPVLSTVRYFKDEYLGHMADRYMYSWTMPVRVCDAGGTVMTMSPRVKTLIIDGRDVSATETTTILEAAQEVGMFIPTLCSLEGLSLISACRLCLVEVKGVNKPLPACVTRVEEGMEVNTSSERLDRYRRTILELLFAEGNHICSVCPLLMATVSCKRWLRDSAWIMCECPISRRAARSMHHIGCSRSIPIAAFFVRAAFCLR